MMLIDPPVTPYHTADEIRSWIEELENMPKDEDADAALADARGWLKNIVEAAPDEEEN